MQKVNTSRAENAGQEQTTWEWAPTTRRLAPLIDGIEYFTAAYAAIRKAKRQILIIGWDLHSEVELLRGPDAQRAEEQGLGPTRLADLLEHCVQAHDHLQVRIVIWDASPPFSIERQHLPRMRRPWEKHPRINLAWAADAPSFASYHEKVLVVDDRVAFAGGMDLTKTRWDAHEHKEKDPRRRKPGLIPFYGNPYHDVMLAVDGEAARTFGGHCRMRWQQATGETIDPPQSAGEPQDNDDPWPDGLEPLLTDRRVYIARTQPPHKGLPVKRQVEYAFIQQIRSAERFIYIETQYLAAESIAQALCDRLAERDGPEIVLILPFGCPGTIQAMAMDDRRDTLIQRLRAADTGGRLGVYWPTLAGGNTEDVFKHSVYVHAKTMVIDDRLMRIGSANLNNRSMGLDTELDVFVQVDPDDTNAMDAIGRYRRRSLAYLLDVEPDRIAEAEQEAGSLVSAIQSLCGGERTLHPFEHRAPSFVRTFPLDFELADPKQPLDDVDAERVLQAIAQQTRLRDRTRGAANVATGVVRRWWRLITLVVIGIFLFWSMLLSATGPTWMTVLLGILGVMMLGACVLRGWHRRNAETQAKSQPGESA